MRALASCQVLRCSRRLAGSPARCRPRRERPPAIARSPCVLFSDFSAARVNKFMAATVVELAAFTPVPAPRYRSPLLAASIRVAMASTCMCGTPRTCSASARRPRAGVFAGHGDAAGHRARVVHERAVGVARGHPAEHARRNFPDRHARRGAHGRDRHAHGAVLAAAHVAQGRPPAPPALVVAHPPPQNVR